MLSVVVYIATLSVLMAGVGLVAERVCAELGRPRRGIWIGVMIASVLLPIWMIFAPRGSAGLMEVELPFLTELEFRLVPEVIVRVASGVLSPAWPEPVIPGFIDTAIGLLWAVSVATLLGTLLLASRRLKRVADQCSVEQIGGREILISDQIGPAIFGFFRPRIVLPRWIVSGDLSTRELVLSHETSHISARDPLLVCAALLLLSTMPWNLAMWWQFRRLRAAIEVDCDARVIGKGYDEQDYSEALLAVRQASWRAPLGAVALTEPVSELERRIKIMLNKPGYPRKIVIASRTLVAAVLLALAVTLNAPSAQQSNVLDVDESGVVPAVRESVFQGLAAAQACVERDDLACAHARLNEVFAVKDLNSYETAQYWNFLAFVQFGENDPVAAAVSYEQVLAQAGIPEPFRRGTLQSLVRIYRQTRQYERAFDALDRLYLLDGETPLSLQELSANMDEEFMPIVRVAPVYPPEAAAEGLEGYVVLEYTVTEAGGVSGVTVVESSSDVFEQSAMNAGQKFKYQPRVVEGQPVAVSGVRSVIRFVLESEQAG